jgi:hypothetical protein
MTKEHAVANTAAQKRYTENAVEKNDCYHHFTAATLSQGEGLIAPHLGYHTHFENIFLVRREVV